MSASGLHYNNLLIPPHDRFDVETVVLYKCHIDQWEIKTYSLSCKDLNEMTVNTTKMKLQLAGS